jgi:transcriptional regulator with XRE-family HTH domain
MTSLTPKSALAARRMIGLSRAELAARAGLTPRIIQCFEEEATRPTPEVMRAIKAALERAGVIFLENGALDSAQARVERYRAIGVDNLTVEQKADYVVQAGVWRRSGT